MSIIKNTPDFLKKHEFPFTIILNKAIDIIEDRAALGVYLYLASKPEKWEIWEKELMNRFKCGRDAIRNNLRYLKKVGLIKRVSVHDEKGHIIHWETTLYNEPQSVESSEKEAEAIAEIVTETRAPENPSSGEDRLTNATLLKNQQTDNPTHINKRKKNKIYTTTSPKVPFFKNDREKIKEKTENSFTSCEVVLWDMSASKTPSNSVPVTRPKDHYELAFEDENTVCYWGHP